MKFCDPSGARTRRDVLHGMAAGTTILTLPQFLAACGPKALGVQAAADGTPVNQEIYNTIHKVGSETVATAK